MPQRWLMLVVLFLVRLAMGYQFQSVASVSSYLVTDLGFSFAELGTLIGFFLLPGIFISIPSGLLTRRITNKNLLLAGAAAMTVGALVMGNAASANTLFAGRIITGIGGAIFNVILTKMVTEWFIDKEIVTALAIMLTAWPIGISLGLISQGAVADACGWGCSFDVSAAFAFASLVLTAALYRDAPARPGLGIEPVGFRVPRRQFAHVSVISAGWALFNASIIVLVSFGPDVLVGHGYSLAQGRYSISLAMWATLLSIPLGGRVLEVFGWINASIFITLAMASALMVGIAFGIAPELLCIAYGLFVGIPAGALVALTSEALTAENRGPGLGIYYTGYYVGMTIGPVFAGWTRDASGSAAAPILLGAVMLVLAMLSVLLFRVLQKICPVTPKNTSLVAGTALAAKSLGRKK